MAINIFDVILHNTSGLPRDNAVNRLYYDITIPDTDSGIADDIANAYQTLATDLNAAYVSMTIKAYDPGGGPPKRSTDYTFSAGGGFAPTEIALCLSYRSDDAGPAGQRRGRIYLPWAPTGGELRPGAPEITTLLNFGQSLKDVGSFSNTHWNLFSRTTGTYHSIDHESVDNEWDTQRRRGMRATSRTTRDF